MMEKRRSMTLKCKNGFPPKSAQNEQDFMIVIGDQEIPVHKQILMDVSPVLDGMFDSGMKESIENKMFIEDFSFKVVDTAIKLCYRRNGIWKLTFEEILSLYQLGDKYQIEYVMNRAEECLIKVISPFNVCQLTKFSAPDNLNVKKLHQSCLGFLVKCSKESISVYGSNALSEKLLASIFLSTLCPNIKTNI